MANASVEWASKPDSSVIQIAEAIAADPGRHGLLAATRTLLPVADIAVMAHSPVTTASRSAFAVLRETAAIRAMEGGNGHHMGMMAEFDDAGEVAFIGNRYPYPDGSIGAWGYDLTGEHDLGPPDWISDYHFARALDYRLADERVPAAAAERSIFAWGGVDGDGAPFLDPASSPAGPMPWQASR